mgnify:CR=1 FL=1
MPLRIATIEDLNVILELRLKMLEEVAGNLPEQLPSAIYDYLNNHLNDGSCLCALFENDGQIVAKAMLCIYDVMPDEVNICGKCATLFSVYTLPNYRGHGYMQELLLYLLECAKEKGIQKVFASAEKKAIPLYTRIGFTLKNNEMGLTL